MDIKSKIKELKAEADSLEKEMQSPGFWQNRQEAAQKQKRYSSLKEKIGLVKNAKNDKESESIFLKTSYDHCPAIITVQAGAGGRDAQDWAAILLRMYQRYAQSKSWPARVISQSFGEGGGPEGRVGIKEASLEISEDRAYGVLRGENGVHRLVRLSPFSAKNLRHTSFAKIEVVPLLDKESSPVIINPDDLKMETFRASGPGGQYVNRRESAVRLTHLPTGITVSSQAERLQGSNRSTALKILQSKLQALKDRQKQEQIRAFKGDAVSAGFGRARRSYVLHPYKIVKDTQTNRQTSQVEKVLDGQLELIL